jgi:integrase
LKADQPHEVPLSDAAVAILQELPRFKGGGFLFSTTHGEKPVGGFGKAKAYLDEGMLIGLPDKDGETPELEPFVLHDIRRTVRTRLAGLAVPDPVCELVIAHRKQGLHKVYDQHRYLDEKRKALDLWAARLRDILEPPPDNVVALQTGGRA